jgi:hypothetical protein
VYRGGDFSSIEGKTRLRRGRLVYRGGGLSTEDETLLRRDRLRGRLVHGGGHSSTKGEARLGTILDAIGNVQNGPNTVCAECTDY